MCGITGFVDYSKKCFKEHLNEQLNSLKHRGPDDSGIFIEDNEHFRIGLGNRRLSIIDPSQGGHQPFISECTNFILIFNGTIYNYKDLKQELSSCGIRFKSDSDTEVLLQAYINWPDKFLKKINGNYAFALYDKVKNKVILVRDPIGVKPLMYFFNGETLIFGSELRVFLKNKLVPPSINKTALNLYLQYSYFPGNNTIINNVLKVTPGEKIEFDLSTKALCKNQYWELNESLIDDTKKNILEGVESLIIKSVKSRLVSDASIGFLLSGGYDSSIVASIAQKQSSSPIKTFSIGFEEDSYNEAPYAKKIAQHIGSTHKELYFDKQSIKDLITNHGKILDEPVADSGAIGVILAAKLASEDVKVLLSGEGGDELFGGYHSYFHALKYSKICGLTKIPASWRSNKYLNILSQPNSFQLYNTLRNFFSESEAYNLTEVKAQFKYIPKEKDKLNELLYFDLKNYLPEDLLWKADRCMMHFGVENRDPLLNIDLIKYVSSLPIKAKCPNNQPKQLLKDITHKYIPPALINRPKKGFSIPVSKWLSEDLKDFAIEKLNALSKRSILNSEHVLQVLKNFLNKPHSNRRKLWTLLSLELWIEEWMD